MSQKQERGLSNPIKLQKNYCNGNRKEEKSDFSAISINRITVGRYREFSKKISESHTLTI